MGIVELRLDNLESKIEQLEADLKLVQHNLKMSIEEEKATRQENKKLREGIVSDKIYQSILNHTDLWNWYWLSYGEKCYAFAVVSAYPVDSNIKSPDGGQELFPHSEKENVWTTKDNIEMYVDEFIVTREEQNGDTICMFIAEVYTNIFQKALSEGD
jgi:hypothetical protein